MHFAGYTAGQRRQQIQPCAAYLFQGDRTAQWRMLALEGEHGRLDADVVPLGLGARDGLELPLVAAHGLGGELDEVDAEALGREGEGARGAHSARACGAAGEAGRRAEGLFATESDY